MSAQISVIIPVHRQIDHIEATIRRFAAELGTLSHELLLVVNGSDDGSWDACVALTKQLPAVHVHRIAEGGWGRAVRTGIDAATGELLCFTNSARTAPGDLRRAIDLGLRNPDVVIKAQRRLRAEWHRRIGSVLFNFYCRALFGLPYWDINGTPKVFARRCDALLRLRETGDLFDLEFLVACRDAGYLVLEFPIMHAVRYGGRSTTGFRSAAQLFAGATGLWSRARKAVHAA